MIRLILGFLMIYGVVGSLDAMSPEQFSDSVELLVATAIMGTAMMLFGVKKVKNS